MPTQTANYGLNKDDPGDFYSVIRLNENLDKIDTELKKQEVALKEKASFKSGTGVFTARGATHTVSDSFCTSSSLVTVVITGNPLGTWDVNSANGSFTITSDVAETKDVAFNYFITKVVAE